VLNEIKELESRGFSFEAAEASVAIMLKRQEYGYKPPFELDRFLRQCGASTGTRYLRRSDGQSPRAG
jgi:2-isopropylmalate synthase